MRRSFCLIAQAPPLHPHVPNAAGSIGAMKKLKAILLAAMLSSVIGLAGCAEAPSYYRSYGYPTYGYYYPWWGHGRRDFDHGEHFDHDHDGHAFSPNRFGALGLHNGPALAQGAELHGDFRGGHPGGQAAVAKRSRSQWPYPSPEP